MGVCIYVFVVLLLREIPAASDLDSAWNRTVSSPLRCFCCFLCYKLAF